ncbi:MAG: hypothetical protein RL653_735, partial [Pseudomonadota bacterium]
MMLLTAVTFGGQEAAVPVLAHLPDEEAALLRHRAERLLEIPRERRVPLLVQEIKKLVTARRSHLWSAEPEALARMLEKERPALRELILRALPVALADAVRLHLPAVAVEVREEVSPGVLGVIRWKLEGLLQEASAGTLWKFSDLLMLKPRELYTLADRQGCRALATAFAALLAEEQAQLLGTLPPEISQLAQRAIAAAAGRELPQADARALLSQHGVESSPLEGIRSAGIQRLARACLAQGPEFAARLLERHRPPFAPVFQKWMNDERTRAAARGDGGRTEVVADLERLEARGLVEKPSRLPAMSRKPVVPPPAAAARPPPAAPRPAMHAGAFSPIAPRPPQSGPHPAEGRRQEAPARADTPPLPSPAVGPGAGRPRPSVPAGDATWEAPPGPLDPRVVTAVKRAGIRAEAPAPEPSPAPGQDALHSDFPATPMPQQRTSSLRPAHEQAEGSPPRRAEAPAPDRRPGTGALRGEFRPAHEQDAHRGADASEEGLEPGPTSPQRPGRMRPPPDAAAGAEAPVGHDDDEATQAIRAPRPLRGGERRISGNLDRAGEEAGAGASRGGERRVAPGRGVRVGGAAEDPSTAPRPGHPDALDAEVARTDLPHASRDVGRPLPRAADEGSASPRGMSDRGGAGLGGEGRPRRSGDAGEPQLPRTGGAAHPSRDGRRAGHGRATEADAHGAAGGPAGPSRDSEPRTEALERVSRDGARPSSARPGAGPGAEAPVADAVPRPSREGGRPGPGMDPGPRVPRDSQRPAAAGRPTEGRERRGVDAASRASRDADAPGVDAGPRVPRDSQRPATAGRPTEGGERRGVDAAGRASRDADAPGVDAGPRVPRDSQRPATAGRPTEAGERRGVDAASRASRDADAPGMDPGPRVPRPEGRPASGRPAEGVERPGVDAAGRASR